MSGMTDNSRNTVVYFTYWTRCSLTDIFFKYDVNSPRIPYKRTTATDNHAH